jgi:hypothetical protein
VLERRRQDEVVRVAARCLVAHLPWYCQRRLKRSAVRRSQDFVCWRQAIVSENQLIDGQHARGIVNRERVAL